MTLERRTYLGEVEFRAEGKRLLAYGYAARFDTLSQNLGGFVERIKPGAFAKTVQEADIRALFNHSPDHILGRNKAGTLSVAEDADGLPYEIDLPDNGLGRDLAVSLERGDITGSSFGFRVVNGGEEWSETDTGFALRTLTEVALRDVGPVTFPAYTEADSALRSLAEARSLDLPTLIEAAKANKLSEALRAEDTEDEEQEEERRETPTPRHRSPYAF